jgi:hypothetical protein
MTNETRLLLARRGTISAQRHLERGDFLRAALALDFVRGVLDDEYSLECSKCAADVLSDYEAAHRDGRIVEVRS